LVEIFSAFHHWCNQRVSEAQESHSLEGLQSRRTLRHRLAGDMHVFPPLHRASQRTAMMALINSTEISEPQIISQSILFCLNRTHPRQIITGNPLRRTFIKSIGRHGVVPPKRVPPFFMPSQIHHLFCRVFAGSDAVRKPNPRISVSSQMQVWIFFNQARNTHNAVLVPHVILRHRQRPARDK
jgi:hypothetical protein